MRKSTYEKLKNNPHYKISKKQEAEMNITELDLETQQMVPGDLQLVKFKGKRRGKLNRN